MSLAPIIQDSKLQILQGMQKDFLGTGVRWHEEYGDNFTFTFPFKCTFTRNPVIIKHILHDNFQNYTKDVAMPFNKEIFKLVNNYNSLFFTPDFDFWKKDRTISTPSFLPSKLATFVPRITTYTEEVIPLFENSIEKGQALNIKELFGALTMKNMLYNLFQDCHVDFVEFHYQMKDALDQMSKKGLSFLGIKWLLPTKDRSIRKESYNYVQKEALKVIEQREKSSKNYDDLLNNLLKLYNESFHGDEIKKSLVGEIIVYLIAGHDTTAATLNAIYMYFSLHPDVEAKVLAEMESVLKGQTISYETANQLIYTKMVFQEALRLQFPINGNFRWSIKEDHIAGLTIPAGSLVSLSYRMANRHPDYWDNPEAFNPERFRTKRWGQDEQYAYLPFGGGPRMCIGMNFAYLEAVIALSVLLPKYRLTLIPGRQRFDKFGTTTWPGGAEEMMVSKR
jgi:cytochrome P450